MIRIPDSCKTDQDVETFFAGIRAGIEMAADRLGKTMTLAHRPAYKVKAEHLLNDLEIFQRQAKDLVMAQRGEP